MRMVGLAIFSLQMSPSLLNLRDRDRHHRHWRLIDQFYAVGRLSAVL